MFLFWEKLIIQVLKIVDPEVNVLHALSLAGDITQFGNRKKIKIMKRR